LEYESIVLYRFVPGNCREFLEITDRVDKGDLDIDTLDYRRARDKGDPTLSMCCLICSVLRSAVKPRSMRNSQAARIEGSAQARIEVVGRRRKSG
jgi:hypothetical protein